MDPLSVGSALGHQTWEGHCGEAEDTVIRTKMTADKEARQAQMSVC